MTEQNGVKKNYCSMATWKNLLSEFEDGNISRQDVFITRFILPFTEIDASYRRRTQFKAGLDMTFQLCL